MITLMSHVAKHGYAVSLTYTTTLNTMTTLTYIGQIDCFATIYEATSYNTTDKALRVDGEVAKQLYKQKLAEGYKPTVEVAGQPHTIAHCNHFLSFERQSGVVMVDSTFFGGDSILS